MCLFGLLGLGILAFGIAFVVHGKTTALLPGSIREPPYASRTSANQPKFKRIGFSKDIHEVDFSINVKRGYWGMNGLQHDIRSAEVVRHPDALVARREYAYCSRSNDGSVRQWSGRRVFSDPDSGPRLDLIGGRLSRILQVKLRFEGTILAELDKRLGYSHISPQLPLRSITRKVNCFFRSNRCILSGFGLSSEFWKAAPRDNHAKEGDPYEDCAYSNASIVYPISLVRHCSRFGDRYGVVCLFGMLVAGYVLWGCGGWFLWERRWGVGWSFAGLGFLTVALALATAIVGCLPWDWGRTDEYCQSNNYRPPFQHDGENVSQKPLDAFGSLVRISRIMDWKPKATIPTFIGTLWFLLDLPGRWGVLSGLFSRFPSGAKPWMFHIAALCIVGIGIFIAIRDSRKKATSPIQIFDENSSPLLPLRKPYPLWVLIAAPVLFAGVLAAAIFGVVHHLQGKQALKGTLGTDDDDYAQYDFLNLKPDQKAELDRIKAEMYRTKAEVLDLPEHYRMMAAKETLRKYVEGLEDKYHFLTETDHRPLRFLPRPPANLGTGDALGVDVSFSLIADELTKNQFWVIHNRMSKLRIPIVLYVSIVNRTTTPMKIDVLYLEERGTRGWVDLRRADVIGRTEPTTMQESPLIFCAENGCVKMDGDYLMPSLYDRVIQPGSSVGGWLLAEYPRDTKYGSSIRDLRLSLRTEKGWETAKIFTANPPTYGDHLKDVKTDSFYFIPLDTLMTEDY
jgi:hypothetical protein